MSSIKCNPSNSSRREAGEAHANFTTSIASVFLFGRHDGIGEFSGLVRVLGPALANILSKIICILISVQSTPIGKENLAAQDASKSFFGLKARFTSLCFVPCTAIFTSWNGCFLFSGLTFSSEVPIPNLGSFTGSSDSGDITATRDGKSFSAARSSR